MSAGGWQRVRAAFEQAVDLPASERSAFLDRELGADAAARDEVERMLAAADRTGRFLEPPEPVDTVVARQLGPFRLLRCIARGGMGAVHLAEQDHPARTVAIKVVDAAVAVPRARERFRAEVEVLARLQHPGIAQVLAAGVEDDGTAWFAMELLDGALPITRFAEARRLPLPQRLQLFLQVCAAIAHAHQRGVIHRDLKPGNILVVPDGRAKVIDFGIARVLDPDRTAHTLAGELLGTLAYMSPEQIEGGDTDVRTDVHGLGVVLYELLTGAVPFPVAGMSLQTACRRILDQDPPLASRARAGLPPELDWILQRALRKAKDGRYAGVAELAADVQRVLRHEPVAAGPDSTVYRLRKFVRRHRAGVLAAAVTAGMTVVAFTMVAMALVRARDAETAERQGRVVAEGAARQAAASLDFLLEVFSAPDPGKAGKDVRMVDALARAARDFTARFRDEPRIRAALGEAIGNTYYGLGQFEEAERQFTTGLAEQRQLGSEQRPEVVRVLVALASTQQRRGHLDEAGTTIAAAAAAAAGIGDEPLELGVATRAADILRAKGDRRGALAKIEPIAARLRASLGAAHRDTTKAIAVQADVLHELGEVEAALPLYAEVLQNEVAAKGEQHPDALTALNNHLAALYSVRRFAEMQPLLERLVAVRQRVLGEDHADTIGAVSNLAAVSFRRGDFVAAARWFGACLERMDRAPNFDRTSATYLAVLANLATTERELHHYDRAEEFGRRAFEQKKAVYGPSHDSTLQSMSMLADVHRQAGDHARGAALYAECRALAAACDPPQLANVYRCDLGEARCRASLGELAAAEALFQRCLETFDAAEAQATSKGTLLRADEELTMVRAAIAAKPAAGQPAGK